MRSYSIAVVPGDGIGLEVTRSALFILDQVAETFSFKLDFEEFPWGSEFYVSNGVMMPQDGLQDLSGADAIFLGAVGDPRVPDHITLGGLLLPIRRSFQQFANVRPSFLFPGVNSPLQGKSPGSIDCIVVRENTEGEYAPVGGRVHQGGSEEVAVQTAVFTRWGTERIIRFAFDLAVSRGKAHKVTSITKSNAQGFGMGLWDEVFHKVALEFPQIETESLLVDAACMKLIQRPEDFDVLVASNLFGDIVSEITAAVTGSLGLAPSANINPSGEFPSMFEPVHGSAPDIAGSGKANPVAAILAAEMMLDSLGENEAARSIYIAVTEYLSQGEDLPADLGGNASTEQVTNRIATHLSRKDN